MPIPLTHEQAAEREQLFRICQTRDELWSWVYYYLDLDMPGVQVDPESTTTMLDFVWDVYAHMAGIKPFASRILLYANRFGGKTLGQSVIEVLTLVHFGLDAVHLAAIEEQSQNAQRYLRGFLSLPPFAGFVIGNNIRTTEVVLYYPPSGPPLTQREYSALEDTERSGYKKVASRAEIVVATMASVNGKHPSLLCLDEIDIMRQRDVYDETANMPTEVIRDGRRIPPTTILTSTRKRVGGYVQMEIDNQHKTKLAVKHFNILDVTQACPKERHRPDLPKLPIYTNRNTLAALTEEQFGGLDPKQKEGFNREEGYSGCISNCELFASCRGLLATKQTGDSLYLKSVESAIDKFRANSLDMAKAQLMCWKPSSTGQVYDIFEPTIHVITPARAYELIWGEAAPTERYTKSDLFVALSKRETEWGGGMDFGFTHHFAAAAAFKDLGRVFITHALSYPGLDPAQQVEVMAPFQEFPGIKFWPDTAYPGMITAFKKAGFSMRDWKKGAGSVADGINIVKMKMLPAAGPPEFYIIRDIDPDPGIDQLVKLIQEYNWELFPDGTPSDKPEKKDDDLLDAMRYLVMNFADKRGKLTVPAFTSAPTPNAAPAYRPENWMTQIIAERTGVPREVSERKMTIDAPASYYGTQDKAGAKPGNKKRGRLVWDI